LREVIDMKWITRERVKVDRVACPWLIRKFIDPRAEFLFVPGDKVLEVAGHKGVETPPDVPTIEKVKVMEVDYARLAEKLKSIQPVMKEWAGL
jgi:hypothetical protein